MNPQMLVLDASVGALWFRSDPGSPAAYRLLERQAEGTVDLVVPTNFVHEVLACVRRDFGVGGPVTAFAHLQGSDIAVAPLTAEIVREAAAASDALGCSFYEALAPAVATVLQADLVSADERAHGRYPGVRLIG